MKRAILQIFILSFVFLGLNACDDVNEDPGEKSVVENNKNNDNNINNKNNDKNNANNQPQCVASTDCASGICLKGVCQKGGDDTCDGSGECGNCDPLCKRDEVGTEKDPFVVGKNDDTNESSGVILDDEGAVTIGVNKIETNFIWIANTEQGTISKVDTRTYKEVARYLTGPKAKDIKRADGGNDPSRTSVNTYSDVYVGNRNQRSVTKISVLGEHCPDTNGDGKITTSSGASDVLPWGKDDCILWNTPLTDGGVIRAVAAQDGHSSDQTLKSGVWVGGWDGKIWKLDSDTGNVLLTTPSPTKANYGFALDGLGNLWISAWSNKALGRVNTLKCRDTASCSATVCNGEGAKQDKCVKQKIPMPQNTYGITVDFKQRVWFGGYKPGVYDPTQAANHRITYTTLPFVHGIAADHKGWVWGAAGATGVYRVEGDHPAKSYLIPKTNQYAKGIAVDLDGKVWSINREQSSATVIIPGAGIKDNDVKQQIVKGLVSPYTYSDMTGAQLRFATNELGFYRRVFEGCSGANIEKTVWEEIRWDVETPGNSTIVIRARGADSKADLAAAPWVLIATIPPDQSPKNINALFNTNGLQDTMFIQLEAQLKSARKPDNSVEVPRLKAMAITKTCPRVHQ